MLTFLGGLVLAPFAFFGLVALVFWSSSTDGVPPEKLFQQYIMRPIPRGVSNVRTVGWSGMTGSDLVIMFDSEPSLFPSILGTNRFAPVEKADQADCERNCFSDCPAIEDAEYFEDVPNGETIMRYYIKANRSRTRVYYALERN